MRTLATAKRSLKVREKVPGFLFSSLLLVGVKLALIQEWVPGVGRELFWSEEQGHTESSTAALTSLLSLSKADPFSGTRMKHWGFPLSLGGCRQRDVLR